MNIPNLTLIEAQTLFEQKELVGLFFMKNEEYHAAPGLSKSSLDNMSQGPEYFKYKLENPDDMSTALIVGSAYHNLLMNDEPFDDLFYITKTQPQKPVRDDRARQPLSQANFELCDDMVSKFKSDPINAMLLKDAIFEIAYFWIDEETGVQMKGKDDIWLPEKRILIDPKTIADLNKIHWAVKDRRYYVKAALSLDGMGLAMKQSGKDYGYKNPDIFLLTFQEKSAPFRVRRRNFGPNSLVFGEKKYREDIDLYVKCETSGRWIDEETLSVEIEAIGANSQWDD